MMTYLYAFLIGGGICVIGQILMDATKLTAPRVLVILVTAGALMQAFHLYEPLVNLAQTGARVPLPGFGYSLAKGAMEGAKEYLLEAVTGGIKHTGSERTPTGICIDRIVGTRKAEKLTKG